MFKISLKKQNTVLAEIKRKFRAVESGHLRIFAAPIKNVVDEIKRAVSKGSTEPGDNHIYTSKLYSSIKYKANKESNDDGFTTVIRFGYFVPYGINLEESKPRTVSLDELENWSKTKELKLTLATLQIIQKNLKVDPGVYPHIGDAWDRYSDLYFEQIIDNVREILYS